MRIKQILIASILLVVLAMPAFAGNNSSLQMPSAIRGWNNMPTEGKTWAQTLIDWGATIVIIVAIGALLYHFIHGRFADHTGGIQQKNDSTTKMVDIVISAVVLIVAMGFIWSIFWK
jgi:uncharacterized membrane protein